MEVNKIAHKELVKKSLKAKLGPVKDGNSTSSAHTDNLGCAEWQVSIKDRTITITALKLLKKEFYIKSFELMYYYAPYPNEKLTLVFTTVDMNNNIFTGNNKSNYCGNGYNIHFEWSMQIVELVETEADYSKLLNDYAKMLNLDVGFSDLTIKTNSENKIFKAHKAILAARSPVFDAMFSNNMKEKNSNVVEIIDVNPDVLKEMISFMYYGSISDKYKKSYDLFIAADKYQIEDLMNSIYQYLLKNVNDKSIIDCLKIAEIYDKQQLRIDSINYIVRNYDNMKSVIKTKKWLDLISKYPALMSDIMEQFYRFNRKN